jgi:hypothetical protein
MENSCVRLVPGALFASASLAALKLASLADPSWPVVAAPVVSAIAWTVLLLTGAAANFVLGRVADVLENWRERLRASTPEPVEPHGWCPLPPSPAAFTDSRHGRLSSTH